MDQDFLDLSGINQQSSSHADLCAEMFPILKKLSPLSLRILNDGSHTVHVAKGVEIIHEGDAPHDLYFLKSGKMYIAKQQGSDVKVLAQVNKGNVCGESGLLRKKSRFASVFTAQACEIIRVDLTAVQQVLDADPDFKRSLNNILCQRMLEVFLFSHAVFKEVSEAVRKHIAEDVAVQFYDRGSKLFTQGAKPSGIYFILSGEVDLHYLNRNRIDILLEVRRDYDIIGELASHKGESLAYSAIAASDLEVLLLDASAMKSIGNNQPDILKKLETHINKRAKRTAERLKEGNHQTDI